MNSFRDDIPVDAYLEGIPQDDLREFLQHLRDYERHFAAGKFGLDDFTLTVDPDAVDVESYLFAAVVFGYKWHQANPTLLSDSSVTLDEYVERVEPEVLGQFFAYLREHQVAYEAGDLTDGDIAFDFASESRSRDGEVDVGRLLVKAVIFGVKWADERPDVVVIG